MELRCQPLNEEYVERTIATIVDGLGSPRKRFLALWRLLPDRLDSWISRLPADTRIPDHTVIHHTDITAAIAASLQHSTSGGAILSFVLGPVQSFIDAARSVRDLWTGSAILSWLSFQAMQPILDALGPTAFIYPSLRGNPLLDLWLRNEVHLSGIPHPEAAVRMSPSLPHRFVALVPWGNNGRIASELSSKCRSAFRAAWERVTAKVHGELAPILNGLAKGWSRDWEGQNGDFFDVVVSVVPANRMDDTKLAHLLGGKSFKHVWNDAAAIRALDAAMPAADKPRYAQRSAGRWQAQLEYSARVMEANRQVRHVPSSGPATEDAGAVPAKCSLFGSWEQMGPAKWRPSIGFWEAAANALNVKGVRLKSGERFCAIALAKRFAGPAFLASKLDLAPSELRFPDTATVAAAEWLQSTEIDVEAIRSRHGYWSGQWLHDHDEQMPSETRDEVVHATTRWGKVPSYYAVLKMDGDDIGSWLRGDRSPMLRSVLHPKMVGYFEALDSKPVSEALRAKRPVGPALHASISAALGKFASRDAPKIVRRNHGTIIYCGGDDLLALLPAKCAVRCAQQLRTAFRDGPSGMGSTATISAGIAYVHYKEDLRLALQAARNAEKFAKDQGKDRLYQTFMRRSGEHTGGALSWRLVDWFSELVQCFSGGASSRWVFRIAAQVPILAEADLPALAIRAQIIRICNRIEDEQWHDLAKSDTPGEFIARMWERFLAVRGDSSAAGPNSLYEFIGLCGGAAFVARGQD